MFAPKSMIAELETAVHSGSLEKRVATMQRVTEFFLNSAEHLNDEQIGLFDNVLLHLVTRVETKALAELSRRLAPAPNAPIGVIQHLARHDDIGVAGPVLSQSERLSASDLVEIAKNKGHGHLLAISDRALLVETVTDILLERGNKDVFCKLAKNSGAAFSKAGFESLVNHAKNDAILAEKIGQRIDVPRHLLQELVLKATDAVRMRLLATAPSEMHEEIKRMLATISNEVVHEVRTENRNNESAQEFVFTLQRKNQLKEPVLCDFARKCELERLSAAIALMTSMPFELIDRLMRTVNPGGLVLACKAADLTWATVETILTNRFPNRPISFQELEQAKTDFSNLAKPTAIRMLGYWRARPDLSPT